MRRQRRHQRGDRHTAFICSTVDTKQQASKAPTSFAGQIDRTRALAPSQLYEVKVKWACRQTLWQQLCSRSPCGEPDMKACAHCWLIAAFCMVPHKELRHIALMMGFISWCPL